MSSRRLLVFPLALLLAACGPSGGADKGGKGAKGGPPGGMPPPEVTAMTVAPKAIPVAFEYVGHYRCDTGVIVRNGMCPTGLSHKSFLDKFHRSTNTFNWAGFAQEMEKRYRRDIEAATEIDPAAWKMRGAGEKVKEWFARRWEHLL